jgi:gliding motility-associated-like protein
MSLDDGLGDVIDTVKNVFLVDSTDEKITATPHANGVDYWLMLRRSGQGQYCAFLVTENGVSHTPVVSNLGNVATVYGEYEGNLRFNHKGNVLVNLAFIAGFGTIIEFSDFDNTTGVVSNLRTITPALVVGQGLEFSPDDSKLYTGGPTQFDVTIPTIAAIEASEVYLGGGPPIMGGLQLGLDGKIYGNSVQAGFSQYLEVINNPNEVGFACNHQDSAVFLEGKIGRSNVPQFLSSYFVLNLYADTVCVGEPTEFYMNFTFIDSVFWDFGDPASGAANTSTALDPTHTYNDTGVYTVTLIAQNGIKTDTVIKTVYVKAPPQIDIGPDVGLCMTTQDTVRLASGLGSKRDRLGVYRWSINDSVFSADSALFVDSAALRPFPEFTSGKLSVTLSLSFTNECGSDEDTALIYPAYPLSVQVPPAMQSCTDSIQIEAQIDTVTAPSSLYWFSAIDTATPVTIAPPLTTLPIYAVLSEHTNAANNREFAVAFATENACGIATDSTLLRYIPMPDGVLPNDSIHCLSDSFYLTHPQTPLVSYQWNNGSNDSALLISSSGTYTLQSTSECGLLNDAYTVDFISIPNAFLPVDSALCFDAAQPFVLQPNFKPIAPIQSGAVARYAWSTGAATEEIRVAEPGTYTLTITAGQCIGVDTINLTEGSDCAEQCTPLPPNVISPNDDGINDQFIATINCTYQRYELLVFNRWGQKVHHDFATDNSVRWDATTAGNPVTEGTYYYIIQLQKPDEDAVEYYGSLTVVR